MELILSWARAFLAIVTAINIVLLIVVNLQDMRK